MQRKLSAVAIAALAATTLLGASAPAFAGEEDSLNLITSAAPDLISEALSPASDAAGDLSFSVAGGTIHVPDDAGSGVVFSDGADSRVVGLPTTESATSISDKDGVRVYDNADDTLSAVAVNSDYVSMFTVIESASAPTAFSYSYEQYGTLRQSAEDGGVTIWDGDTQIGFVYAPWALDANGTPVPTHYEVDGNTLTQVVDHHGGGFVYPIVADPTYTFPGSNSLYSRIVEDRNASTGEVIIRVYVNQNVTGWQRIPRSTLVDNYNAIVSSTYERQNLWDQLVCHAVSVPFMKPSWNLETWRPNVGYAATVAAACNPT